LGIDDASLTQKLFEIEKITKEMSQSIDDYRGLLREKKETVLLHKLLEEIAKSLSYSLEKESVAFSWSVDEGVSIKGDAQLLKQVIVTLIDNARDALVSRNVYNAEIKLDAKETQESLSIILCDNAGGMSKGVKSKIFDADFTTKHASEGTGLGLYMAKKLLHERLNASLDVKNVNRGVCFEIKIPKG
jgi:signal transduction histidine kinase